MPAEGFFITVPKVIRTTEQVAPEMRELTLVRGDADTPTRIKVEFVPTDAEGRYRSDVIPVSHEMEDLPLAAFNPELLDFCTLMRQCIIKAVIPAEEPFVGLGVAGLSIEQAGPLLMGRYFALREAETVGETYEPG